MDTVMVVVMRMAASPHRCGDDRERGRQNERDELFHTDSSLGRALVQESTPRDLPLASLRMVLPNLCRSGTFPFCLRLASASRKER